MPEIPRGGTPSLQPVLPVPEDPIVPSEPSAPVERDQPEGSNPSKGKRTKEEKAREREEKERRRKEKQKAEKEKQLKEKAERKAREKEDKERKERKEREKREKKAKRDKKGRKPNSPPPMPLGTEQSAAAASQPDGSAEDNQARDIATEQARDRLKEGWNGLPSLDSLAEGIRKILPGNQHQPRGRDAKIASAQEAPDVGAQPPTQDVCAGHKLLDHIEQVSGHLNEHIEEHLRGEHEGEHEYAHLQQSSGKDEKGKHECQAHCTPSCHGVDGATDEPSGQSSPSCCSKTTLDCANASSSGER